jgi:hypothetical protein
MQAVHLMDSRMMDRLDWVAAAGLAVAALILFLAIGRYAYGESHVRCAESPGKGQWHSRQVDGQRCWFKGYPGKFSASELYWPAPEAIAITGPMPAPDQERRWVDPRGWSHQE